jgi:hypothetical protein
MDVIYVNQEENRPWVRSKLTSYTLTGNGGVLYRLSPHPGLLRAEVGVDGLLRSLRLGATIGRCDGHRLAVFSYIADFLLEMCQWTEALQARLEEKQERWFRLVYQTLRG